MQKVSFNYADRKLSIRAKKSLKIFIPQIFERENKQLGKIDYIFCSDEYLLQINQTHLQHDFYTDIITFDLSDGENITSEIYISVDRVKDNAKNLSANFETEMLRVIFHGALHLCGYKDKSSAEQKHMRAKEDQYIELYLLGE